jgi:catechol 2,3-dioxygenase-like lactoylglutathione lyase family enzyme
VWSRARCLLSLVPVLLPSVLGAQAGALCRDTGSLLRLDHVVIAVPELAAASDTLRALGFRIKDGRVHADGLSNRHVKFRDGTGLELMSLASAPRSAIARDYAARIARSATGAFAVLWTSEFDAVASTRSTRALSIEMSESRPFRFLVPHDGGHAAAVFVGTGGVPPVDPDSLVNHANGVTSLAAAWIEAGRGIEEWFSTFVSASCGPVRLPDGRIGTRWPTSTGSVVLVLTNTSEVAPRLLGVELERSTPHERWPARDWQPFTGFWLRVR